MWFTRDRKAVRRPAVAGSFYPGDAAALRSMVADFLAEAGSTPRNRIRALVVPHAGYVYSGSTAAEGFAGLKALQGQIDRVVVIGPAHYAGFTGIAVPSAAAFRTPLGEMPLDRPAIDALLELPQVVVDDGAHAPEHALEVELPFLQAVLGDLPLVPLVVGSASPEEVAAVLARLWDEKTLVVVSSDLSHYHDYATARRRDSQTAAAIEDFDEAAIGFEDACGALGLRGLLIEAKRRGLAIERLALRNSGDTAGDRRQVVGYGAWAIEEP